MTITASDGDRAIRAFLVSGQNDGQGRGRGWREGDEPAQTVSASSNATRNPDMRPRAWLDEGRVVKMTPRALGRFQSLPDSYHLPDKAGLATRVIGNGVPVLLAQRIGEAFLRGN